MYVYVYICMYILMMIQYIWRPQEDKGLITVNYDESFEKQKLIFLISFLTLLNKNGTKLHVSRI